MAQDKGVFIMDKTLTERITLRVVSFDHLKVGDEFMFSLRDKSSFIKLADHSYMGSSSSGEISNNIRRGQIVFTRKIDIS